MLIQPPEKIHNKKRVNFDLAAGAHAKLKIYAVRQGKSINDALTECVEQLPD